MDEDGYMFEYSVVGSDSSWMQSHGEWSDGISTHGSYNVKLPDGRIQKVKYTADERGFRPVVSYETPQGKLTSNGQKNHINTGTIHEYDQDDKSKVDDTYLGRKSSWERVLHHFGDDYNAEEHRDHHTPPFYEITQFYEPPTHEFSPTYDEHDSYKSYEPYKQPKVKSKYKAYSPPLSSSYQKTSHPVYHMMDQYQQDLIGSPKQGMRGKSLYGKYTTGKAKTYYMDKSEERKLSSSSSVEVDGEEVKDNRTLKSLIKKTDETGQNKKKETRTNKFYNDHTTDDVALERLTPKPGSFYHDNMDKAGDEKVKNEESIEESNEESLEDSTEESVEESDEEESSEEEKGNEEDSEEHEEDEEEDDAFSHYMAMLTTMMPPNKPYVPPTYFPLSPSSDKSLAQSTEASTAPHHSMPTKSPSSISNVSLESSDKPSSKSSSSIQSSGHSESNSSLEKSGILKSSLNIIPSSLYSPYHSPYEYHSSMHHHHPSHYHLPHPSHYKHSYPSIYHVSPLHGSSPHPYSHHYPLPVDSKLPSRYAYPYSPPFSYTSHHEYDKDTE